MATKSEQKASEEQPVDVDELLGALDKKLDRCKHLYDQYFQGFEKRPPTIVVKEIVRMMHEIEQLDIRRAGPLFRLRSLVQRWSIYRTMWNRTMREIELGTYKPLLERMARKLKKDGVDAKALRGVRSPQDLEKALKKTLAGEEAAAKDRPDAAAQSPPERPAAPVAPSLPISPSLPGPSPDRVRQLFDEFVASRHRTGESVDSLRMESFAAKIEKQVPDLVRKNGAAAVDFRVVVKDGRTILQAVARQIPHGQQEPPKQPR